MDITRNKAGAATGEVNIYLLWRRPLREAVLIASLTAATRPVVLVRLVNQAADQEALQAACRDHGLRLVTLPVAFAGLHEHDKVLRDAVIQRLQDQEMLGRVASAAP